MDELVYFDPIGHEAHFEAGHPERPERVETIKNILAERGLWEDFPKIAPYEISENVMYRVHDERYLHNLKKICSLGQHYDMDTYTTPESWALAHNAAGGAIAIADYVWTRKAKRGFALTRPPGHHATVNRAMGFCLLNNVALAAEYLVRENNAKRVAIIDFDLHHGNGTQDIFYKRGDVVYISTHQFPHYPGSGALNETGYGYGERATVNIPMPPMSGDTAFLTAFDEIILPLLDRFSPEMLLVSYGFDSHFRDPLGYLLLTSEGYGQVIDRLASWSDKNCFGRIALFLEGGYDLEAAKSCSLSVVAALLGSPRDDLFDQSPTPEGENWKSMIDHVKRIWEV